MPRPETTGIVKLSSILNTDKSSDPAPITPAISEKEIILKFPTEYDSP